MSFYDVWCKRFIEVIPQHLCWAEVWPLTGPLQKFDLISGSFTSVFLGQYPAASPKFY